MLTDRYLAGIPADSRAGKQNTFLRTEQITEEKQAKVRQLKDVANARGQNVAQLALAWVLRHPEVTSALIGASRVSQIEEAVQTLDALDLSENELAMIERILQE